MSTDKISDISMLRLSNSQNTNTKPVNQSVTQSVTVEEVPTKKVPAKKVPTKKETPRTDNIQPVTESVIQTQDVNLFDYATQVGRIALGATTLKERAEAINMDDVTAFIEVYTAMTKSAQEIPSVSKATAIAGTGFVLHAKKERAYHSEELDSNELKELADNGALTVKISKVRELAKSNKKIAKALEKLDATASYDVKSNTLETPYQLALTLFAKLLAYNKAGRELENMTDDVDKLISAIGAEEVAKFGEFITKRANTFDRKQGRA